MRYSDIRTTLNVYGNLVTDEMQQAEAKIACLAWEVISHSLSGFVSG
jgi:hypothetical protein